MKNKVIVIFETLVKSKEKLRRIKPDFYPDGTFWLLAFKQAELCLALENGDDINIIDEDIIGEPDLIIVKDAVLSVQELDILAKVTNGKDLYLIHHYNMDYPEIKQQNDVAIRSHPLLGKQYAFSIVQSHLEGEFYFEELVQILLLIESTATDKAAQYNLALEEAITKRFPNPTLEAKLELLHACLDLNGAKQATLVPLLKNAYEKAFIEFQDSLTASNHLDKLTILRNRLLPG